MKKVFVLALLLITANSVNSVKVNAALVQMPRPSVKSPITSSRTMLSATSAMERSLATHFDHTEGKTPEERKREDRYRAIVASSQPAAVKRSLLYSLLEEVKTGLTAPRQNDLALVSPDEAPRFLDDGDQTRLRAALDKAIANVKRRTGDTLPFGERQVRRADLLATLQDFRHLLNWNLSPAQLDGVIRARFDVYRSPGQYGTGGVLYTAYNDPVFDGSLTKSAVYRFPLYKKPELAQIPSGKFDRAAIQKGALGGKGLELVWLKHPAEAYLFELEGSGLVRLPDGSMFRLSFDGDNGRKYQGLGAEVERNGLLQPADQARAAGHLLYLNAPHKALAELARNPRVIYFEGKRVPASNLELDLVKGRSVAVDTSYFPRDGLGFMTLDRPEYAGANQRPKTFAPVARFALAHDTGNAIRGPGRIDIYWGHDQMAQWAAGQLRQPGSHYCLLLKGTRLRDTIVVQKDAPRPPVKLTKLPKTMQVADLRLSKAGTQKHHAPVRAPLSRARARTSSTKRPKRS